MNFTEILIHEFSTSINAPEPGDRTSLYQKVSIPHGYRPFGPAIWKYTDANSVPIADVVVTQNVPYYRSGTEYEAGAVDWLIFDGDSEEGGNLTLRIPCARFDAVTITSAP